MAMQRFSSTLTGCCVLSSKMLVGPTRLLIWWNILTGQSEGCKQISSLLTGWCILNFVRLFCSNCGRQNVLVLWPCWLVLPAYWHYVKNFHCNKSSVISHFFILNAAMVLDTSVHIPLMWVVCYLWSLFDMIFFNKLSRM